MTLHDHLRVLARRWRIVLTCLVLGGGASAAVTSAMTPVYASTATSFVAIAAAEADGGIVQGSQFALQRVGSYPQVVDSEDVLQPVIDALALPMSVAELQRAVSADNEPDTVLLTVTATDQSPERAQAIAAAANARLATVVERLESRGGGQSPLKMTTLVPAPLPQAPASPRPALNLAIGLLAGLAVGAGLAALREQRDTTVEGHEIESLTGRPPLALVGVIPHVRTQPLVALGSEGAGVEDFRSMRAALQFVDVDHPPRVIVVTSALPGEGKTTTAANLAIVLARSSHRVCLVDADMRRPQVAALLGLDDVVGLSNVVAGQLEVEDAMWSWNRGLLEVLPAGTLPPDPATLLGSHAMGELLQRLRGTFDHVIIDAPPVLPVSDAVVLARAADGALLVARHGTTRREQLTAATGALEAVQARLLGTVLTAIPSRRRRQVRGHDDDYRSRRPEQSARQPAPRTGSRGRHEAPAVGTAARRRAS